MSRKEVKLSRIKILSLELIGLPLTLFSLLAIITIIEGFVMKEKYKKDREKYFAYVDDNNSERIWKAIRKRQW